jgi:hypothetical protein
MAPVQVVWFKRDLRVTDHQPLLQASGRGPVLPLVVVEPELWQQSDASARQWAFCAESLEDLRRALAGLGQPLVVRIGRAEEVLERARRRFGIKASGATKKPATTGPTPATGGWPAGPKAMPSPGSRSPRPAWSAGWAAAPAGRAAGSSAWRSRWHLRRRACHRWGPRSRFHSLRRRAGTGG